MVQAENVVAGIAANGMTKPAGNTTDVRFFNKRKTIYAEDQRAANIIGNEKALQEQEKQLEQLIRNNISNPNYNVAQAGPAKRSRVNDVGHQQETEPIHQDAEQKDKSRTVSTYKSSTTQSQSNKTSQQEQSKKHRNQNLEEQLYNDLNLDNYEFGKVLGKLRGPEAPFPLISVVRVAVRASLLRGFIASRLRCVNCLADRCPQLKN